MRVLVTGGAGFIGTAVCRKLVDEQGALVINVDKLTYASIQQSIDFLGAIHLMYLSTSIFAIAPRSISYSNAIGLLLFYTSPPKVMLIALLTHPPRSSTRMCSEPIRFWKLQPRIEPACRRRRARNSASCTYQPTRFTVR